MTNSDFSDLFKSVFDLIDIPLVIIKTDRPFYTIVALNQKFISSTSTPAHNAVGRGVFEIYKPFDAISAQQFHGLRAALDIACEAVEPVKLPVLHFNAADSNERPGIQSWWQIELSPITIPGSISSYLLCTVNNITGQELLRTSELHARQNEAALNNELKETNEELSRANEELISTIEDLNNSKQNYQRLNSELEIRVEERTRAMAASEKKMQYVLDSLPAIAWTNKPNGEVDYYNKYWYDYTGLTFDETRKRGWEQVIHPDDLEYNIKAFSAILNDNKPGEFEIREKGRDGVFRWFLVRIHPSFDADGVIDGWVGTATDIDSLKQLQQQKDDFISIASHELRTPLTTLKASIQLLDRLKYNPSSKKLPHLIEQANRNVHKVTLLIDDLLNINRIKDGKLILKPSIFLLSELINSCCNHLTIYSNQNLIVTGGKDLQVMADEQSVDQVITNLVSNAIKYAQSSKDIFVDIAREGCFAKVSVIDNGPGIPSEHLALIFQRYYQSGEVRYKNPGLGLGLYISSEIVKQNGGSIGVVSEIGKGSTFWFTLPLADSYVNTENV